jgi:hypothetical protein
LKHRFDYLFHGDHDTQTKVKDWLNTLNHCCGNHEHCPGQPTNIRLRVNLTDNLEGQMELQEILAKGAELMKQTPGDLSSQLCESVNAIKAHFAPKLFSWMSSWKRKRAKMNEALLNGQTTKGEDG